MTTADVISTIIGSVALLLSTLAVVLQYRSDVPRLRVIAKLGTPDAVTAEETAFGEPLRSPASCFEVVVANPGHRPVDIHEVRFEHGSTPTEALSVELHAPSYPDPFRVDPGQKVDVAVWLWAGQPGL